MKDKTNTELFCTEKRKSSAEILICISNDLNISIAELSDQIGYDRPQTLYDVINGKTKRISDKMVDKILNKFPQYNRIFLLTGEGSMLTDNAPEETKVYTDVKPKKYATHIEVKLVTTKARAGFAGSYYSDEYLKDMPTVLVEADKEHKGNYLAFEVDGDSMEPEYYAGDIVICREVKRDLWQYKLHYKEWDFVIAHGTKGIMLKEITDHNVESGEITCHSLNADHADFILNLGEITYLFNIVEHRRSGKAKRRSR